MAGVLRYISGRAIQIVVTYIIIIIFVFLMVSLLPSNFVGLLAFTHMTPAERAYLEYQLGIGLPLGKAFIVFFGHMLTFNYGNSFYYGIPVITLIGQALPRTLLLLGESTIISYVIGYVVGTYAGWKRGSAVDNSSIYFSFAFYNIPTFWLGIVLLYVFAFMFPIFPLGGYITPGVQGPVQTFLSLQYHALLPMIVLVLISLAGALLLMRTSMLDVLGEEYITLAAAKGLKERDVLFTHASRNAMLPLITSFILALPFIVSGAVVTETIFSYQGIGYLFISSIDRLDMPVVYALTFIIAILVLLFNLFADILYGFLDPRVRY
ncbi:MAG: ABC transporter permease [Candidatus Thermoplasmatota archaeon]|nr:ABC transporter permease [Candidatus Thermoplasmatota archaeon]MCL6003182.1 ABC transporter permease [Candidatus Thermoplasmatota archaeon]